MPGLGKLAGKIFKAGLHESDEIVDDVFQSAKELSGKPSSWRKQIADQGGGTSFRLPDGVGTSVKFDYPGYIIVDGPDARYLVHKRYMEAQGQHAQSPMDDALQLDQPVHDDLGEPDLMKILLGAGAVGAGGAAAINTIPAPQGAPIQFPDRKDRR